jgi:hypothetical protein
MKRITGATLATLAAAFSLSVVAYASHTGDTETVTPACADIAGAGFSLTSGVLGGSVSIDDAALEPVASCSSVTYTVYATWTTPGGKTLVRRESRQGDDVNEFVAGYSIRVPGNLTFVCVYVESTTSSGSVLDRAPNSGCINEGPGAPGGGGTYN